MEQFKLKVGRCFALISNHLGGFDLFVTGRRHFLLSERSLSFNNVMITLTSARPSTRIVELASVFVLHVKPMLVDTCFTFYTVIEFHNKIEQPEALSVVD